MTDAVSAGRLLESAFMHVEVKRIEVRGSVPAFAIFKFRVSEGQFGDWVGAITSHVCMEAGGERLSQGAPPGPIERAL